LARLAAARSFLVDGARRDLLCAALGRALILGAVLDVLVLAGSLCALTPRGGMVASFGEYQRQA